MVAPAYVFRFSACVAATVTLLTSCSRPVAVQAPPTTDECASIISEAPIRLLGQLQRETSPADLAAIAWGEPPIVLVCGVEHTPAPDAQVITLENVDWIAETSDAGTVFTTHNRQPVLQLRVPVQYRPEIDAVSEIAPVLAVS